MTVGDGMPQPLDHYTWPTIEERIRRSGREVRRDVDTPDLLAELQREREILTGARYEDVDNTPFTAEEQAEIANQLREIKEYAVRTYSLSEAQTLSLEARFGKVETAAGRIGRKDLRLLFLGVMLEVILTELLPR